MTPNPETSPLSITKRMLEAGNSTRAVDAYLRLLNSGAPEAPDAAYSLGIIFHSGIGIPADRDRAKQYYLQASTLGHPMASFRLGTLYLEEGNAGSTLRHFEAIAADNPSVIALLSSIQKPPRPPSSLATGEA